MSLVWQRVIGHVLVQYPWLLGTLLLLLLLLAKGETAANPERH